MLDLLANFIKMFIVCSITFYVYLRVVNFKEITLKCVVKSLIYSVLIAIVHYLLLVQLGKISALLICVLVYGILIKENVNNEKSNFWLAYIVSFCIAYFIYLIAIILTSFTYWLPNKTVYGLVSTISIAIFSIIITFFVFKIKRIKNGINFIKNFKGDKDITLAIIAIFGIVLMVYNIYQQNIQKGIQRRLSTVFTITSVIVVAYTIYKQITKHYKNNMRDRALSIQKEEIDANVKLIEELKNQNLKLSTTIHKYNHRLSALESNIRKVMNSNTEFAQELSIVLGQTNKVAAQFADETKVKVPLSTTNLATIDNMLEYMRTEAMSNGIDFSLKLSDSIKPLLEKYISEDKFETLIADHIKDAIIAINAKTDGYKSIMVLIGAIQGAYELSIYDTGVEFDIPTLLKLGTEPVTTHKDNGGSGLGFMTTFETLKYSKASLVIEEYDTSVTNYTKSVTIRFDGRSEYRIYSYRADEIKKACSGRKIIIKKI